MNQKYTTKEFDDLCKKVTEEVGAAMVKYYDFTIQEGFTTGTIIVAMLGCICVELEQSPEEQHKRLLYALKKVAADIVKQYVHAKLTTKNENT